MTPWDRINLYMEFSGNLVERRGSGWVISGAYDDELFFETFGELLANVDENLEIMESVYEESGEMDEWNAVVERLVEV